MGQLRMLACFAHPDDEAFPVGGTLATYAARGVDILLICTTSGEEGEIRQPEAATRETLGQVRCRELRCSCEALGIREPIVLGYRDSGMAGSEANRDPRAYVNAVGAVVVERIVEEMRRFRPHVVLTFGSDGLYGHPDHIAISNHTTDAFHKAGNPAVSRDNLPWAGLSPYTPSRLFYSVRPRGFRMEMALKLRQAGVDAPLPEAQQNEQGIPLEQIHVEIDASANIDKKLSSLQCHHTQSSSQRPYHQMPLEVVADIIGREHFIRGYPAVAPGDQVPNDFFHGIDSPD